MSTRAIIGIQNEDGSITGGWQWNDGMGLAPLLCRQLLMEAISMAYYKLENENLSDDESKQICKYINQYGESMGKTINRKYYTM